MKLLLGVLLLLAAFAAAALWQRSWRAEAVAEREIARERGGAGAMQSDASRKGTWGRVIVGRPSGADPAAPVMTPSPLAESNPAAPAERTAAAPDASGRTSPTSGTSAIPTKASSSEVVVRAGDNLSSLCQAHYGTSRLDLVQALARYNGLKDPDHLREGQTLALPPVDQLLKKDR